MISIETVKGEVISGRQLISLVPDNIFNSKTHVETCIMLASNTFANNEDKNKIYIHLLLRQSRAARSITALKFLLLHDKVQCKTLFLSEQLRNKTDEYFFPHINKEYVKQTGDIIDKLSTKNLFLKCIAHRLFRLLGWQFKKKCSKQRAMVRCYVEVSEHIHKNEMANALCVFFPFPYKMSRQINFYKSCRHKGYDTAFFGVPYSVWGALKLLFRKNDSSIVDFEYQAYQAHALELAQLNIKSYFTEDDYVAASFLVGKKLQERGCTVVNRSHGVGLDCPFICTHVFEVLTKAQIEYYKHWNSKKTIEFKTQKRPIPVFDSLMNQSEEVCYIFMHSNFKDHQLDYEGALQEQILHALRQHAQQDGYDIRIKYHPNTSIKEDIALPEVIDIALIHKIKVFITINSASFYSYFHLGPFIFIGDELCNPFNLIDKEVAFFSVNQLQQALARYKTKQAIATALESQYAILRGINSYA